jgi:hypothetical protein
VCFFMPCLSGTHRVLSNADLPGFNAQHYYLCGRVSGGELAKQQ